VLFTLNCGLLIVHVNNFIDNLWMQVLTDFQENPKAAQEHMKNPMVMGKIQKLVNAGIVQVR
jgi:stress-induced-phosphoprotein 1